MSAATMHTAQVIAHPSAVAERVLNPRQRGKYPAGVVSLARARLKRRHEALLLRAESAGVRPGLDDSRRDALARVQAYERLLVSAPRYEADLRLALALARQEAGLGNG